MATFKDVKIGCKFEYNGNAYIKESTRTAKPLFDCHISYFYFNKFDVVILL